MSCRGECSGDDSLIPSFIPSGQERRPRAPRALPRQQRLPTQNEQAGYGPAAPNWRPPPIGSPPSSPRSPLAASSPNHQVSPERQRQPPPLNMAAPSRYGGPNPVGVALPLRRPQPQPPPGQTNIFVGRRPPEMGQTYIAPGRAPPQPLNETYNVGPPLVNATYNIPDDTPPPASPPRRPQREPPPLNMAAPSRYGGPNPVGVALPLRRPQPQPPPGQTNIFVGRRPPEMGQTYIAPGRAPPQPLNETYNVGPPLVNATYNIPDDTPPPVSPPRRQMGVVAPFVGPLQPRMPSPPPCRGPRPVGVVAPMMRQQALDETYRVPGRLPQVPRPPQRPAMDETFDMGPPARDRTYVHAQRPAMGETFDMGPPARDRTYVHAQRPAMDETFDMGPPARDRTYVHAPPRFGETYAIDDSDAVMEELGDGEEWEVIPVVPIEDIPDDDVGFSEEEPSFDNVANSTPDDEPCVPCGGDDVGPERMYDTAEYIENISPPNFEDISGYTEESSLGILPDNLNDSLSQSQLYAMAEAPSNISVYDAEQLNITTAPRNSDLDIPRNRIWMNLINSLNELNNTEELEYDDFVAGIQQQRREWIESFSG